MSNIFNNICFNRIVYEEIKDNKLINQYLFNNNFEFLENNIKSSIESQDKIKLYNNGKLVKVLNNYVLTCPLNLVKYQIDFSEMQDTSYIRTMFKLDGIYITPLEAKRFLNGEIELGQIRDQFQELSEVITEDQYLEIKNNFNNINYIKS